jgi:hypothetical protein
MISLDPLHWLIAGGMALVIFESAPSILLEIS